MLRSADVAWIIAHNSMMPVKQRYYIPRAAVMVVEEEKDYFRIRLGRMTSEIQLFPFTLP